MSSDQALKRAQELLKEIPGYNYGTGYDFVRRANDAKLLAAALDAARLEEAKWWASVDIMDIDTEEQWKKLAAKRIAELESGGERERGIAESLRMAAELNQAKAAWKKQQ